MSSSAIAIQWNPPDVDRSNGVIRYYSIELFNSESGDSRTFTTLGTSYNISNLHPYYNYNISVTAVTVGEGVKSTIDIQMPEDGKHNLVVFMFLYIAVSCHDLYGVQFQQVLHRM